VPEGKITPPAVQFILALVVRIFIERERRKMAQDRKHVKIDARHGIYVVTGPLREDIRWFELLPNALVFAKQRAKAYRLFLDKQKIGGKRK